jgi:hypothetical protein
MIEDLIDGISCYCDTQDQYYALDNVVRSFAMTRLPLPGGSYGTGLRLSRDADLYLEDDYPTDKLLDQKYQIEKRRLKYRDMLAKRISKSDRYVRNKMSYLDKGNNDYISHLTDL